MYLTLETAPLPASPRDMLDQHGRMEINPKYLAGLALLTVLCLWCAPDGARAVASDAPFKLLGTVITQTSRTAYLADATGELQKVHERDNVAGWMVTAIEPKRVVLSEGPSHETVLTLNVNDDR